MGGFYVYKYMSTSTKKVSQELRDQVAKRQAQASGQGAGQSQQLAPSGLPSFVPDPPDGAILEGASNPRDGGGSTSQSTDSTRPAGSFGLSSDGYTVEYNIDDTIVTVYEYYLNKIRSNGELELTYSSGPTGESGAQYANLSVRSTSGGSFTISLHESAGRVTIDISVTQ